jgi:hypothetical protein
VGVRGLNDYNEVERPGRESDRAFSLCVPKRVQLAASAAYGVWFALEGESHRTHYATASSTTSQDSASTSKHPVESK